MLLHSFDTFVNGSMPWQRIKHCSRSLQKLKDAAAQRMAAWFWREQKQVGFCIA